jgi:2,4-dienoyl-CoA reductase-like NADH-dependent reductase (Old Yellow Enzyme family)
MARFPRLLAPLSLRGAVLKNRIVSTAHGTFMSEDGLPTPRIAAYQEARARGGAGLIIHEASSVHRTGVGAGRYATCHTDACIPGYRAIAEAVHAHGGVVFGQLYHPGRGDIAGSSADGSIAVSYAPSPVPCERLQLMPRAMSTALVGEVIAAYGDAARRLRAAGMDGIEIMAHHGHLVSQFLNPRTNHRTDAYGGDARGRLRFLVEIVADVRAKIGEEPPLGLRIAGDELGFLGLTNAEAVEVCAAIDALGAVDYYNVVAGSCSSFDGGVHVVPPMAIEPGYVAPYAAAIKARVSKPVLVTGRINRPEVAERILEAGQADLCGMTRAMICDPELARKVAEDRIADIRTCIGCNQACIGHAAKGASISCIQFPESGRETGLGRPKARAARRKRVLVAGGGPAGLKAAAVAAERGHEVTLYERERRLGGQVLLAETLPGRAEFGGLAANLMREVELARVRVVLGTAVSRATVAAERPDAVVVATGSRPYWPEVEGRGSGHVVHAVEVAAGRANVGGRVAIVDTRLDWMGMGLAEKLAREGRQVRLAVTGHMAGENLQGMVRDHWAGVLHGLGVVVVPYLRLAAIDGEALVLRHMVSGAVETWEGVETVVLAAGMVQATDLEDELADFEGDVHLAGDCLAPRTAEEAVLEGLKAGLAI